ncbi:hypothetical protein CSUB01_08436 [Colletotrichum sublineola]|uniref:Uncharacterized protein n=1 Tax=Colletotrichum sublineola TaxID=1173701 RepID=A0A066XZN4_COLSU|nr:hypothetical protein CSUB01_08436 [Colletotrichum sublineola]
MHSIAAFIEHASLARRSSKSKQPRNDQEIDYSELLSPTRTLLPAQRPRPITSPKITTAATVDALVAALGIFALLSLELRRCVLVAAFGERTIHLDVRPAPRAHGVARKHGREAAPPSRHSYGCCPTAGARQ